MNIREAKLAFKKDYPTFGVGLQNDADGNLALAVRVKVEGQLEGVPKTYAGFNVIAKVVGDVKKQAE